MKCRWHQFQINWRVDDDRPLPARTLLHVETCPRCEAFYLEQTGIRGRLKPEAGEQGSPSPFLKDRILNEIAREECAPTGAIRWRLAGAGLMALVAVMTVLTMIKPKPEPAQPPVASAPMTHEWIELTAEFTSGDNLFRVATNLNQPLEREMNLVIQDARAAWNSLAKDFVPSRLLVSRN